MRIYGAYFKVRIDRELRLPTFSGYYVRALIFSLLRMADPAKSIEIHSSKEYSFSTTPFIQDNVFRFRQLKPGNALFYFYTPKEDVFNLLTEALISHAVDHFLLKEKAIPIIEFSMFNLDLKSSDVPFSFRMDFLTPTYFKRAGNIILYPDPPLLIQNLAKLANMNHEDAFRWALYNMRVSGFPRGIKTVVFREPKSSVFHVGFLGSVNISLKEEDPDWSGRLPLLLELAKYLGVGGDRSMGFGRILISTGGDGK